MYRHGSWMGLFCVFALPLLARAQVPPEKALSTFTVADGLELSLWASEPLFCNPTSIDVDHKGRVWVCESVNYRSTLHHRPLRRKEGDRILILEDTKGTGRADKVTVFYQAPEILAPLGIAVAKDPVGPGYKVFVCQSPDILVFEDKDGDGKADGPPKKLLTGFRGIDHDHGVHGIFIGPDYKLYFTVGDAGVGGLQSSNGKGRKWTSNGTDCRAGTVWRCDLDGKNLELIAHNFRNPYEACVDSFGTVFLSDNDDDGNQQTRICYVMPGGNYGYHPRGPGQTHWHEEQPGVVPKILRTGFGSPTGICVYEGNLLPKKYRGQLIHADAGPREIRCFHLKPKGAGYDVEKELLVTSTDSWFRASDVCVAPDGSIMIADWYDPGVGGHGIGDFTRGRIYRLAPKGSKWSVPKVDVETVKGFMEALASPNRAVRYMALARLWQHPRGKNGDSIALTLGRAALEEKDRPGLRARALWICGMIAKDGLRDDLSKLAFGVPLIHAGNDEAPRFRCLFLRILAEMRGHKYLEASKEDLEYTLKPFVRDPSPAVRREILLFLQRTPAAAARSLFYELAKQYDGKDRFYLCALGIAVGQDPKRHEIILKDFDKHFPDWNDKVADLVWELRPLSVIPLLEKRLVDGKIPPAQRGRIIDILATLDDKDAGKTLLKIFQGDLPQEVRDKVLANLKLYLPGKWQGLRQSAELRDTINRLMSQAATRPAAIALIGVAEKTDAIPRLADLIADPGQGGEIHLAAIRTLGLLHSADAVRHLDAALKAKAKIPVPLRAEAARALGVHAARRKETAESRAALASLQALLTDRDAPPPVRLASVEALTGSAKGSLWLLGLQKKGQLAEDVRADAGRWLRNSSFQNVRREAAIAFPAVGKINPKKLPAMATLLRRKGDANRGKQLLAASLKGDMQCLKCHTIRGIGGQVGPDLSMIGKKASRENLLESILYPSKAVADQFINWVIETKKGQALNGLIVAETPATILLRDGNGKDTKIDKKDIEGRKKSPTSLMPEDIIAFMTEDDLVDVTEYLLGLKTPALAVPSWSIVGPFDNGDGDAGLDKDFGPEKEVDLKRQYAGKTGKVGWRTVKPDGQGYVDLQAFFAGQSNNIVSYLYREIESPADQEAVVLVGTDDGCKVWVNGKQVFSDRRHQAAVPESNRVQVRLKKGRNKVLLKVNNGDGAHGFYFTVLAEQELKVAGK